MRALHMSWSVSSFSIEWLLFTTLISCHIAHTHFLKKKNFPLNLSTCSTSDKLMSPDVQSSGTDKIVDISSGVPFCSVNTICCQFFFCRQIWGTVHELRNAVKKEKLKDRLQLSQIQAPVQSESSFRLTRFWLQPCQIWGKPDSDVSHTRFRFEIIWLTWISRLKSSQILAWAKSGYKLATTSYKLEPRHI